MICPKLNVWMGLLVWGTVPNIAFAQGPPPLVIEGGTLIDGNGGTPVPDVQIVLRGNKIASVGKKGAAIPAGAQVVNADGKFILPGLWNSQLNYYWYQGEMLLNSGTTSFIGIGDNGEAGIFYRQGIFSGKIAGPRPWDGVVHFQGPGGFGGAPPAAAGGPQAVVPAPAANGNEFQSPFTSPHAIRTADEAREWTKRILALGADVVMWQNGGAPLEAYQASFEEAHKAGKAALIRPAGGRGVGPREAALAGADFFPNSNGIANMVAGKDLPQPAAPAPGGGRGGGGLNELEVWSYMDDAKAAELIKVLQEHKVALVPAFINKGVGLQKSWNRFEAEDRDVLGDLALRTYFPVERIEALMLNYLDPPNARPEVRERRTKGYQNALRFHRMYVQAGGHVLAGTDGGQNAVPGPDLHHEAEILAEEGGFTPMQVIQSMTKWPAETLRVQDQIGTIEAGKLADVLIVNANPLQNISNLKDIAWVVSSGTLRDTKYHSWYRSPFTGDGPVNIPPVDQLGYVANLKRAVFRGGQVFAGAPGGARLPIPGIETFDTNRHDHPDPYLAKVMVTEGSPTINLTLNGFNFFDRAQVTFDSVPVPFRVVSPIEMVVTIDESLLRRAGRFPIVVKNMGPTANPDWGEGTSNKVWLLVNFKY